MGRRRGLVAGRLWGGGGDGRGPVDVAVVGGHGSTVECGDEDVLGVR